MTENPFDTCVESSKLVEEIDEFKDWIRTSVRQVLPHGAFVCGHGRTHAMGASADYIVAVDFPVEYLFTVRNPSGHIDTPILNQWYKKRAPIFVDGSHPASDIPETWVRNFKKFDLRNVAATGVLDEAQCVLTYFSFHRLPSLDQKALRRSFGTLIPVLHETLSRVILKYQEKSGAQAHIACHMTAREREIVRLISQSKSNGDIAKLLCLAESTVKNRVSHILDKTGCANRAGLVALMGLTETHQIGVRTKVL
jgi:DNA-binding CsgD family transcriptional regulator